MTKYQKENTLQKVGIILLIEGPSLDILWWDEVLVAFFFEIVDRDLCIPILSVSIPRKKERARVVRIYLAKIFPLEDFIEFVFRPRRIFFRQGRMPSVEKVEFQRNNVSFSDWRKVVRKFTNSLHHTINIPQWNQGYGRILPSGGRDASRSGHEPTLRSHQRNL